MHAAREYLLTLHLICSGMHEYTTNFHLYSSFAWIDARWIYCSCNIWSEVARKAKVKSLGDVSALRYVIEIKKRNKDICYGFQSSCVCVLVNWNGIEMNAVACSPAECCSRERVCMCAKDPLELNVLGTRAELIMTWIISYFLFALDEATAHLMQLQKTKW